MSLTARIISSPPTPTPRYSMSIPTPPVPQVSTGSTTLVPATLAAICDIRPGYPCEAHTSAAAVPQRPAATDLEGSSRSSLCPGISTTT